MKMQLIRYDKYSKLDVVALNESLILASGIIRDAVTVRLNTPTLTIARRIQCILKFMLIFVIAELNWAKAKSHNLITPCDKWNCYLEQVLCFWKSWGWLFKTLQKQYCSLDNHLCWRDSKASSCRVFILHCPWKFFWCNYCISSILQYPN